MAENEKLNGANGQTPIKKKVARRGVSNNTQAVSQLKFHEKDAAANGLFIGHLHEVRVDWSVNADGKTFTGLNMPRLTFHFASNHKNANEVRHVYQTLFPIESNVDTIPNGQKAWRVDNLFKWIKHLLDVYYLKGRELTEQEEEALTLPFVDFDDDGGYVAVEPEEVLAGYKVLFENTAAMLNGTFNIKDGEVAKPTYKTVDGQYIPAWIKLLRHKKVRNEWVDVTQNGDLGFDTFIGNGVVEIMKKDTLPSVLRIDFAKESITPKETRKAPTIGGINPAMPSVMPAFAGEGSPVNSAFNETSGEMPF